MRNRFHTGHGALAALVIAALMLAGCGGTTPVSP